MIDLQKLTDSLVSKFAVVPLEMEGCTTRIGFDELVCDLRVDAEDESIFIYAALAELPKDLDEETATPIFSSLFQQLLQAHYNTLGMDGFAFGVDPDVTFVNLQMMLDFSMLSEAEFFARMEKFMTTAIEWSRRIETLLTKLQTSESTENEDSHSELASDQHLRV